MGPADTVDNFSSSPPPPQPTHNLSTHTYHSSDPAVPSMASQGVNIAELGHQLQQLLAATAQIQQQFNFLLPGKDSSAPVDPVTSTGGPVEPPFQPVQSESTFVAPAAPAVSPPFSHVAKIKVATPDIFTGDLAKSEEFINSLHLYFYGNPGIPDDAKITFALSYMKGGTAGQWSKRILKEYSQARKDPSWDSFLDDFRRSFSDPDPQGTARHKLKLLKQGNHTCDEYVASFKEVKDETGFNEEALKVEFERGLSKSLVDRIYNLPEFPETLEEWMTWALKFDRQARRREERLKQTASSLSTTNSQPRNPPHPSPATNPLRQATSQVKPPSSDVVPMEIDASRKKAGPRICYRCRKPGHIARDCKSKFDINALDYAGMKAHFMKELEEEAKNNKEKTQDC
jgi:hypothetical protein